MIEERDISVAMRDGIRLAMDVYRPDKPGKYPVLYAAALHNKDLKARTSRTYAAATGAPHRFGSVHRGRRHAPLHRQMATYT